MKKRRYLRFEKSFVIVSALGLINMLIRYMNIYSTDSVLTIPLIGVITCLLLPIFVLFFLRYSVDGRITTQKANRRLLWSAVPLFDCLGIVLTEIALEYMKSTRFYALGGGSWIFSIVLGVTTFLIYKTIEYFFTPQLLAYL